MDKYYFRVDANDRIGIGHMMRCFSIAGEMRKRRCEATFFVADRTSAAMAADAGFGYYLLNTDYDHLDVEADRLLQVMRDKGANNLLVDSYFVTENYLKKIREVANVVYIDDIDKFIYPCDLLINYNIYADSLHYEERYRAAGLNTKFALGLDYMPLRKEYIGLAPVPHDGFRVLVTTGATDSMDICGHLLRKVMAEGLNKDCEFICILGRYNHNREALLQEFGQARNIHLIDPQKTLADLVAKCDMAVTAGGTTVYELCAGGLPSVMLTLADNQMNAARTFSERGIIPYAGDVRSGMEETIESIADAIRDYHAHPEKRAAVSERMKTVVDGRGAERIADMLIANMRQND